MRTKKSSSHLNKKALREPLIEIGVHTRRQDGIPFSDRHLHITLLVICEGGDSNETANIQTVGHGKKVGVFHEPEKQPLQKLILQQEQ